MLTLHHDHTHCVRGDTGISVRAGVLLHGRRWVGQGSDCVHSGRHLGERNRWLKRIAIDAKVVA